MQITVLILSITFVIFQVAVVKIFSTTAEDYILFDERSLNDSYGPFKPHSPLVKCSYLPKQFLICDPPLDLQANQSQKDILGYGCIKWGGQRYQDVERTKIWCVVLDGIECHGERMFLSAEEHPCIRYNGHYFVTTLIYSVLLGFLGMDRFCLGHTGTAVGKLLTVGGVGIWWIVDVILLVTGQLAPMDGSNWMPFY